MGPKARPTDLTTVHLAMMRIATALRIGLWCLWTFGAQAIQTDHSYKVLIFLNKVLGALYLHPLPLEGFRPPSAPAALGGEIQVKISRSHPGFISLLLGPEYVHLWQPAPLHCGHAQCDSGQCSVLPGHWPLCAQELHPQVQDESVQRLFFFVFFFFFVFLGHAAYGSSQARDRVRATAAGLNHSHSNVGSKPPL